MYGAGIYQCFPIQSLKTKDSHTTINFEFTKYNMLDNKHFLNFVLIEKTALKTITMNKNGLPHR